MLESDFQKSLVRELRDAGAVILKIHGHAMQAPGWPDLYIAHHAIPGGGAWLELKRDGHEPTELQAAVIRRLRAAGTRAGWACPSMRRAGESALGLVLRVTSLASQVNQDEAL